MIFAVNFQFKQLEKRSLKKNQGFNGIQTRDLRDTSAMLYQLSYEATHNNCEFTIVNSRVRIPLSPDFFQASLFQLLKLEIHCEVTYHLHIYPQFTYESFHILHVISLLSRENMNTIDLIAQEHRTGIAEVTGSNPVEALIFFQASLFQLLKLEIHCEDHISPSYISVVHI